MVAAVSDASSTWLLPLWVLGVVVLALVLGYAIYRAGYLHRGERERLDRNTDTIRRAEAGPEMQRAEEQRMAERSPPLADVQQPTPPAASAPENALASPQERTQPRQGARNTRRARKRH